jgi:hypothetical protein
LMPTVQMSTAWRSAADTRAAINTRPLVRDSHFVIVVPFGELSLGRFSAAEPTGVALWTHSGEWTGWL